jgi:hypothetical protein
MVAVSRAVVLAALLCALVAVPHVAEAQSAARGSSQKILTGKVCNKSDKACVKCVKSTSGGGGKKGHSFDCLACSTGPVDAELDEGVCVCPAGSALTGSKLTVKAAGGGGGGGKKSSSSRGGGGKNSGPATCSECGADSFAPESQPVSASRCSKCPTGTTTRGETGSATCYVEPGQFFDPSKPDGQQVITCPADQYCPGGDISAEGLNHPNCPAGSSTLGTTGNEAISDCVVPPGSYYNGKDVVKCEGKCLYFDAVMREEGPHLREFRRCPRLHDCQRATLNIISKSQFNSRLLLRWWPHRRCWKRRHQVPCWLDYHLHGLHHDLPVHRAPWLVL